MRFTRDTRLTPNTPTTYDPLPSIEDLTTEEFMELPFAVRQRLLRDAMAKIDQKDD